MLVLTRRPGEEIIIADNIRVTVVAIKGQQIRVGITAPPSVNVARQELLPRSGVGAEAPTAGEDGKGEEPAGASSKPSSRAVDRASSPTTCSRRRRSPHPKTKPTFRR